ncbi:T9SS type A sorting domain-containing protein [Emticicia soli]|uniref:T9SS type A sorting domain-containing protein n=1 Tax=Emticicia soli TaxID=2027878 RepID=A0ABW5JC62_9BACT
MARRLLFTWTLFIICSSFVLGNSNQNDDILEFLNVKETYCYETKTTLTISIPKSVPANTKFKVSLQSLYGSLFLGSTTQSTIDVQLPAHFGGEYFVVESEDGQYRATSRRINIIGGAKPLIIAMTGSSKTSSAEVTHCDGYSTKLFSDTFGHYYQWRKDGLNINGANNREFDAIESGDYSVSVSRNGCSAESNIIRVKLGSIPNAAIKSITGFQSICKGFTVPMLETTGFGYDKYVWKHNGRIVAEKTTNEIFEARETGYYLLEASQGTCKKVTDSIYISISDLSKSLISVYNPNLDKGKIYVCDSSSTNFYNGSLGVYNYNSEDITQFLKKYGLNFQWKRNGMDISDAKNPYTLTSNKPGKYVLQVKQGECIVNSNQIEVVLQEKVAVKLLSSSYGSLNEKKNSVSVCIGDSLSIYPDSKVLLNSWNKYLYRDGKLIESRTMVDGNNFGLYFSIYESGAYYLKLSSSLQENCSSISDTINIEVANKIITLPVDTFAVCKNVLYTFSFIDADSLKLMYNNKVISYNPPTIILDLPGLYALEGKKNNGCTIIKPYLKEEKIKPYVTSKRFYSLPFPDPVTSCKGNEVNLAIAGLYGPYTLEWYNNDKKLAFNNYSINVTESGNYFAKVKYMDCEATTNAIKVDMVDIKKTISPTDSLALCINGGFETLEASKENGYTYEWFKDNTSLEETASSLKVTQAGIYKALIQAGDCSALTSSVKVYPSTQLPTATISGDTLLNVGDTANLKLSFTSNPPFTYKLSNNQEGTSQTNTIIHPIKVEEANIFKLASVKNACGEGTVSGEAKIQVIILANEPLIGHKVVVAPVPAESYCEIIFDLPTSQEVSYQLLDVKGQKLSEKNLGQVTYKKQYLNLNHLTAGEYLIRIQIGKDFVTRKLIKF